MNRAERAMSFGAIAADYDRLRPAPADAAIDWLLPERCEVAVDVGAGTGLLTRALAGRAGRVVAVEPDERMRAVLAGRSPGVEVVGGLGEAIPLPDASADGVFVSSAWHWMDPERAVPEIARVLRDGGRFGLIWTSRDREFDWLREMLGAAVTGRADAPADAADPADPAHPGAPAGSRPRLLTLPDDAPLRGIMTESFRFTRLMTVADLIDLLGTYSGVITARPADREAALAHARVTLEQRFPGASEIEVPMRSWCWRADRVPRH